MSEKELSLKLKFSPSLVREAFIRSSDEKHVEILRQLRSHVPQIRIAEVEEAQFLRQTLGTPFVRRAEYAIGGDYAKKVDGNLARQQRNLRRREFDGFMFVDEEFHLLLRARIPLPGHLRAVHNAKGQLLRILHRVRRNQVTANSWCVNNRIF